MGPDGGKFFLVTNKNSKPGPDRGGRPDQAKPRAVSTLDDESLPDESLPDSAANDNEDDEGPLNGHHGQVGNEHLTAKLKQMAKTLKKMGQGLMSFLGTLGH
ncbi:hypothetical protein Ddc_16710 [Ditylenchus destructor]|nr:hypothetical protein Ddc_16710 [Ditylenchus destructor]